MVTAKIAGMLSTANTRSLASIITSTRNIGTGERSRAVSAGTANASGMPIPVTRPCSRPASAAV